MGAGAGTFRQAQAWLHTWCGLWFSWLLYAVFLTGTLSVFADPLSHWMTPEHHAEEARAEAEQAAAQAQGRAPPTVSRAQRLAWGVAYMTAHHPTQAMWEFWPSDIEGRGPSRAFWFDEQGHYASVSLDPATGQPLVDDDHHEVRETWGGSFLVDFHYELHAGRIGLWIVAAAAMAMLVALVSGVITHKRIFKDFFTFRRAKGQRSWLDAHNAVAVLTLPFQLMIAYTGLAISAQTLMPAGLLAAYPGESGPKRFTAEREGAPGAASGHAMPVPALEPFAARAEGLIGQGIRAVVVDHPGDAAARIRVYGWNTGEDALRALSPSSGMASFEAATGEQLHAHRAGGVYGGAATQTQSSMEGLHMASFGGWPAKWLYFLCGLAGTAMMATGAILFVVKRRVRHQGEFGALTARVYRLVEGLNVAAVAGLPLACAGYLWANRLVPLEIAGRAGWEQRVFFALWALALLVAFVRRPARAWRELALTLAALCLLLPVLNLITTGDHLAAQVLRGDWESAGVEGVSLLIGSAAAGVAVFLWRRSP